MNKKTFKKYMQQGLGRCVVTLEKAENPEKYKDIVLWGCLHNLSYDTQCEGTRADYVFRLASYFDDDEYFVLPTAEVFLNTPYRDYWLFSHFAHLLELFAENGNITAKNALEKKYRELLSVLIVKKSFRGLDFERDCFVALAVELANDTEVFMKIISDIGGLFKANPHYDWEDFEWFYVCAESFLGKKRIEKLLEQGAKLSRNIAAFWEDMKKANCERAAVGKKQRAAVTAEQIERELDETGEISAISRVKFETAEQEEKEKLALKVLEETDLAKKEKLLYAFVGCGFPFAHDEIIGYTQSESEALRETAFAVLAESKSEEVHGYARELLTEQKNIENAILMLVKNYKVEDKDMLLTSLATVKMDYKNKTLWHEIGLKILDVFNEKGKLTKETLFWIYENTLCSCCREYALRALAKHRWLTREIIEECRFDSNDDIVNYVNRYYKIKTSKEG